LIRYRLHAVVDVRKPEREHDNNSRGTVATRENSSTSTGGGDGSAGGKDYVWPLATKEQVHGALHHRPTRLRTSFTVASRERMNCPDWVTAPSLQGVSSSFARGAPRIIFVSDIVMNNR
jgi:hypothetical protein